MSLINDLRLDVGDDDSVIYPTGSISVVQPIANLCPDTYELISDLRVDIGDDSNIVSSSGSIAPVLSPNLCPQTSLLISDIRVDVGDDGGISYPTGSVVVTPPTINACAETYLLITDLRVDIGDDSDVDFGIVNPPLPEPEAPEIWGTNFVTNNYYQAVPSDVFIFSNPSTSTAVTIVLPTSPILGQIIIIKDMKGDAFINNITVSAGVNLIDGWTNFIISQNKQAIMITWNGVEWNVV